MGSNSAKAFGAAGRDDLLWFEDDQVVIVTDTTHVLYDERVHLPLDEKLVLNIMVRGVIEPITVRKNGEKKGKPIVEVVDGRQRVRAVREANKRLAAEGKERLRIPAVRKRGDDADIFGIMVGTFIRQDDLPISRAKKIIKYLNMGKSDREAAVAFGLNVQTVRASVSLLDCAQEVQDAVERREVATGVALTLAKLPRNEQVTALTELKKEGATKGASGIRAAEEKIGRPPRPKLRTRKQVESLLALLESVPGELPDPRKVLRYLLGDDGALAKKWHQS